LSSQTAHRGTDEVEIERKVGKKKKELPGTRGGEANLGTYMLAAQRQQADQEKKDIEGPEKNRRRKGIENNPHGWLGGGGCNLKNRKTMAKVKVNQKVRGTKGN